MKNKLFVEIGNSNIKISNKNKILFFNSLENFFAFAEFNKSHLYIFVFTGIVFKEKILLFFREIDIEYILLDKKNIKNSLKYDYNYGTLGVDRIICNEYLTDLLKKDFMYFSFGTAIAINSVEKNVFKGGAIFPSNYKLRESFKNISSLKDFEIYHYNKKSANNIFFNKTEESIINPIYWAVESVIKRYIDYSLKNDLVIVISGGDRYIPFYLFPNFYFDKDIIMKGLEYVFYKKS